MLFSATETVSFTGPAKGAAAPTVTVTVAVAASPLPSVIEYVNVSAPLNPAGAEYNTTSSVLSAAVPLSETLINPPFNVAVLCFPFTNVNGSCATVGPSEP